MTEPTKKQYIKKVKIYPSGAKSALASRGPSVVGGKETEIVQTFETLSNGETKITATTKDGKPVTGIVVDDSGTAIQYQNGNWNDTINFAMGPTPSKTPSALATPSLTPNPTAGSQATSGVTPGGYGAVAGAYGNEAVQGAFYNNYSPDTSVYTDPNTGAQIPGAGTVPTKDGPKTISKLVMDARNPKNLGTIRKLLVDNGIISKGTRSITSVQNAWLQVLIGASTSQVDPEDYVKQLKASGFGQDVAAANYPSRSVYQYSPEQLGSKIDEVAQNILGRTITAEDKAAGWYQNLSKNLNDMVMQGTVTTTKTVKNPKTGKLENVTIQKPEVTTEGLTQKITGALETADPESLARKQRLDFTKWLYGQMGGNQ